MDSHYEGREYDLDIQDRPQECIQRLNQDLQSPYTSQVPKHPDMG